VVGLHLKSKGIFQAYEWSKWWSKADANRKKIVAQCTQLRQEFVDYYLTDASTKNIPLIICGDINDGPGHDASERRLNASGVETLMGTVWKPNLCLGNVLYDALDVDKRWEIDFSSIHTTSFRDPIFHTYRKVWIDHILYSRNHPELWIDNAKVHNIMPNGDMIWEKYKFASDHFPVTVEIDTDRI
jgi:exonuclease III